MYVLDEMESFQDLNYLDKSTLYGSETSYCDINVNDTYI